MSERFLNPYSSSGEYENVSKISSGVEQQEQELNRIFEALKKYWNREDYGQSFPHILDIIEVMAALHEEKFPKNLKEAQNIVKKYHSDWQKIGEIAHSSQESFEGKELADLMLYQQTLRQYVRRISKVWKFACREYWYRNNQPPGVQYLFSEDEFVINILDVDTFLTQPQEVKNQLFTKYPELNEIQKRFHVDELQALKEKQRKIEEAIHRLIKEKPEIIIDLINKLQNSEEPINDQYLDDLFGIKIEEVERKTNYAQLKKIYPNEDLWSSGSPWTSYELVRTMVRELQLNESDVFYDLGSGFGRVPIYISLATGAQCKGIEIVPERVAESIKVKNSLGIDNLEFIQGNILDQDYSDGNVFFLFNPFSPQTLEAVNEKLRQLAKTKKIKVVSSGASTSFFNHQSWLKPIKTAARLLDITIYESQ